MASYGGVPPARLYVLPGGAFLEVEVSAPVEHMEVDHRMKQHRAVVALASRGDTGLVSRFVHER